MVMQYSIVGGFLKIPKSVFVQEMLSKDSLLRILLNWQGIKNLSVKHPCISEPDQDNIITINFDTLSCVDLNDSPKEILSGLKAKYKDRIKGKVACRAVYSMYGGVFAFQVDLSSSDDKADYIMN